MDILITSKFNSICIPHYTPCTPEVSGGSTSPTASFAAEGCSSISWICFGFQACSSGASCEVSGIVNSTSFNTFATNRIWTAFRNDFNDLTLKLHLPHHRSNRHNLSVICKSYYSASMWTSRQLMCILNLTPSSPFPDIFWPSFVHHITLSAGGHHMS